MCDIVVQLRFVNLYFTTHGNFYLMFYVAVLLCEFRQRGGLLALLHCSGAHHLLGRPQSSSDVPQRIAVLRQGGEHKLLVRPQA